MLDGLFIMSLVGTVVEAIKNDLTPTIPAENWANKKALREDIASGMSIKEQMKNVEKGKYKITEIYPEPHRDKNGKIIIENFKQYYKDLMDYDGVQVFEWLEQGKYNLTDKELELERKKLEEKHRRIYSY